MKIYIFDLDNTLLNQNYQNYDDIKIDDDLCDSINSLNSNKYIYSNATKNHVLNSLEKLNIDENKFINIFTRDDTHMKPNGNGYKIVNTKILFDLINLEYNSNGFIDIIFFDDLVENLYPAKIFGWTTVLINKNNNYDYDFIDYQFNDVKQAIKYLS